MNEYVEETVTRTAENTVSKRASYCGAHLGLVQCVPKVVYEYTPINFPGREVSRVKYS